MGPEKHLSVLDFVVVAHTYAPGAPQRLRNFLKARSHNLLYIGHPFSYCRNLESVAKLYNQGELSRSMKFPGIPHPFFLYVRDVLATLFFILRFGRKYDVYIGADCLNAFVGIVLRRLGFVRIVVFYTIDYSIKRFRNPLLNHVYHLLDKMCAKYADFIWNVSDEISKAREFEKSSKEHFAPQVTVPIGVDFDRIKRRSLNNVNMKKIAYVGGMTPIFGPQLLFQALPELIKEIPDLKLIVIGTGPMEKELKDFVDKEGLNENVVFYGYLGDHSKIEEILTECSIGFAPYMPDPYSYKSFADVTKPKVYMACGLPVVITRVPPIAKEVKRYQTGVVINYDKEELIEATLRLLSDRDFYKECRKNAIAFASKFKWNRIFNEALEHLIREYRKRYVHKRRQPRLTSHKYSKTFYDEMVCAHDEYKLDNWRISYIKRIFKSLEIDSEGSAREVFLDVGVGATGYTVIEASRKGLRAIGIDLSAKAMKKAHLFAKRIDSKSYSLCEFIVCSAVCLPFRDESFKKVSSIAVLEHVPDDSQAIKEISRVMKNGGSFFITVPNAYSRMPQYSGYLI